MYQLPEEFLKLILGELKKKTIEKLITAENFGATCGSISSWTVRIISKPGPGVIAEEISSKTLELNPTIIL